MDDYELQEMRRKALESLMRKKRVGGDSNQAPRRGSHLMDSGIGDEGGDRSRLGGAKGSGGEVESESSSDTDDEVFDFSVAKLFYNLPFLSGRT